MLYHHFYFCLLVLRRRGCVFEGDEDVGRLDVKVHQLLGVDVMQTLNTCKVNLISKLPAVRRIQLNNIEPIFYYQLQFLSYEYDMPVL